MSLTLPDHLLDEEELQVLQQAVSCVTAVDARAIIEEKLATLAKLADTLQSIPSLYEEESLAGSHRSLETLIEQVASQGGFISPIALPLKSSLARDYVLAKVQTFKAILLSLETAANSEVSDCKSQLQAEIGQSIFTLMAEEILLQIIIEDDVEPATKRLAGQWLVHFWDRSITVEIDDFCPLLESAWQARNQLVLDFGTLMGSVEVMRLISAAADPRFMDFFTVKETSEQMRQAFEEFLFGLTYEQLERLRSEMESQGLTAVNQHWVAETLDLPESELLSGGTNPEKMFDSYHKRRQGASYRRLRESPGPQQTAELFLMLSILQHH